MECFRDEYGNWRFLPSQVLAEPDALLEDLLALKSFGRRFEAQLERKRRERNNPHGARTT